MLKMPECKGVIGIDSCMQHFAASAGRKSVVIWGGTRWTQLGYPMHKILIMFLVISGMIGMNLNGMVKIPVIL